MNQTLAIIKPDAMKKGNMDNIKKDILDGGFNIDDNGAFLINIPMNLDYLVTNEFGERISESFDATVRNAE